ncbi:superoxide dismutase family protein [Altererythrobacter sp. GH1-8]|uniref:superoxide dismutase family protein n=1 Tax=Altererythrobacter sp. GH1-8 TaxID=3349333 RepID=UPI00374C8F07
MSNLRLGVLCSSMVLAACGSGQGLSESMADAQAALPRVVAQATLSNSAGENVGEVSFTVKDEVLSLHLQAANLPPGESGFHIHTTGLCEGPDFKSAGGHLNPREREHGADNPSGKHLGDLPNISIGENGDAEASIVVSDEAAAALLAIFDADGSAVMIHADPDDYKTDPTGNAGSRIACGVIAPID